MFNDEDANEGSSGSRSQCPVNRGGAGIVGRAHGSLGGSFYATRYHEGNSQTNVGSDSQGDRRKRIADKPSYHAKPKTCDRLAVSLLLYPLSQNNVGGRCRSRRRTSLCGSEWRTLPSILL